MVLTCMTANSGVFPDLSKCRRRVCHRRERWKVSGSHLPGLARRLLLPWLHHHRSDCALSWRLSQLRRSQMAWIDFIIWRSCVFFCSFLRGLSLATGLQHSDSFRQALYLISSVSLSEVHRLLPHRHSPSSHPPFSPSLRQREHMAGTRWMKTALLLLLLLLICSLCLADFSPCVSLTESERRIQKQTLGDSRPGILIRFDLNF